MVADHDDMPARIHEPIATEVKCPTQIHGDITKMVDALSFLLGGTEMCDDRSVHRNGR